MLCEMDMELGMGTEELLVGSCNNNNDASSHIAKGKRTKRLRPLSPCAVAAAAAITSSSSSASGEHGGGDYGSFSSTTTTTTFEEEEEDMANCLILLAQGKRGREGEEDNKKIRQKSSSGSSNRRFSEVATAATATATTKVGFYIYECKTCSRTFPSFQALGGHRASHKKSKINPEERKAQPQSQPQQQLTALPLVTSCGFEEAKQGHVIIPPISLQLGCGASNSNNNINRGFHGGNNKPKIHECSICGSEFTSGQALGGHMRRHRASTGTSTAQVVGIETSYDAATAAAATVEVKPPRNVLELDLNLPAPEDDHHDSKFQFVGTQKSMVLSAAPALVGCHY